MPQRLFVYGSLKPGFENAFLLEDIGGNWEEASVKGIMFPEDWVPGEGYPGLILDENAPDVRGFIFSSEKLQKHWNLLDEFEGEEYRRVRTLAQLKDKSMVEVYVYVFKLTPSQAVTEV